MQNRGKSGLRSLCDSFGRDLRHSVKALLRRPVLSVGIVLTLALVIGVNTASFVVLYGAVFRHLPYDRADRLVMLWENDRRQGYQHIPVMEGAFPVYQRQVQSLDGVAAFIPRTPSLPADSLWGEDEPLTTVYATSQLFQVLRGVPVLGRTFIAADDVSGAARVAVLSAPFWKKHLNGSNDVIGKPLALNQFGDREVYTIVGVMPDEFEFPYPLYPDKVDLWLSLHYAGPRFPSGNNFYVLARLRDGFNLNQAQAELDAVARRLQLDYPRAYGSEEISVVPLQAELTRNSRAVLFTLTGALGFVFLIGCANVANLVMARAVSRDREMAIRAVLGAGRMSLVRHLLAEAVLLALAGGVLGFLLAYWSLKALPGIVPPSLRIPRLDAIALEWPVLAFTAAISIAALIVFGLLPALRLSRPSISDALKSGSLGAHNDAPILRRPGSLLLVSEVAIAVVLLAGATLMIQSLRKLTETRAPFQPEKLLILDVSVSNSARIDRIVVANSYRQFLLDARSFPGVQSAAVADFFPLNETVYMFALEGGGGTAAETRRPAALHVVTPEYFEIMKYSLLRGRLFNGADTADSKPVALVNESMVQHFFPNVDPIGARLVADPRFGSFKDSALTVEGIVKEPVRFETGEQAPPAVYALHQQVPLRNVSVVVRTTRDPRQVVGMLRDAVLSLFPGQMNVYRVRTGDEIVGESVARSKFTAKQLSVFAVLATILAGVGIYALVSFYTERRTHEIGVRMALGATPSRVLILILRQGLSLVGLGVLVGSAGAFWLTKVLSGLFSEVQSPGSSVFLFAGTFLMVIALAASYAPARRAAGVNPMTVLRDQ